MKLATLLLASITVLAGTGADGATVTFTLVNNWDHDPDTGVSGYAPGRWVLYATDSRGDNLGMSRWSAALTGWETMQNVSPQAYYGSVEGGFTALRDPPNDSIEMAVSPGALGFPRGSVNLIIPGVLIFGFGQNPGSMTAVVPPGSIVIEALLVQDNYGVQVSPIPIDTSGSVVNLSLGTLLLARGSTTVGGRVEFAAEHVNNLAGVFRNSNGNTEAAFIMFNTLQAAPEPDGILVLSVVPLILSAMFPRRRVQSGNVIPTTPRRRRSNMN